MWEGIPGEADDQTALLPGAHQAHFHAAISLEHCVGAAGLVQGVRCYEEVGVSPGLHCLQQAVLPDAQPLLPGLGQELTELQRKLFLQPHPCARA